MTRERAAIGGRIDHADNRADKGSSLRAQLAGNAFR
jgi:hypothetical protein